MTGPERRRLTIALRIADRQRTRRTYGIGATLRAALAALLERIA